jgi:tRNA(adenine34) deaminase
MPTEWDDLMDEALAEAEKAFAEEEVPIGAVLVSSSGKVLARDHNRTRQLNDPTAHAEMLVLRRGADRLHNFRLRDTALVVTIEPCLMCAGAIVQARVEQVVFGAADSKAGALGSLYDISNDLRLNHRFQVVSGVKESYCQELMRRFFRLKRKNKFPFTPQP